MTEPNKESAIASLMSGLSFWQLALLVVVLFTSHNYMQELLMSFPCFGSSGILLGYLEILGVTLFSYIELSMANEKRKAPWSSYVLLCACLLTSSATSNLALNYINYPTKLVPTMIIAVLINRRRVSLKDFACGIFVTIGMILFAVADFTVYPEASPLGLVLVSTSVVADAFLPNFQEQVFKLGASRVEVTFNTNLLSLIALSISCLLSGDIQKGIECAVESPNALVIVLMYTIVAFLAISSHMQMVRSFGGIATVFVGNARKALTIVLSFILFPKPNSYLYVIGGVLVFGSLTANGFMQEKKEPKRIIHSMESTKESEI